MTLQQLRCFTAVARTMSFARAADQLFISQPAVSHHLRSLENELGVQLVERSLHRVALTPAGERFYLEATDMLAHLDAAVMRLRGNESVPEMLHIGFESTIQIRRLPEIFRAYKDACPDICIYCHELSLSNKKQLFRDGRIDVMFTNDPTPASQDAAFAPLFEGYFCCVMPPAHPLAARSSVQLSDLHRETLILLDDPNCPLEMDVVQREIRMKCFGATLYYSTSSLYSIPMIEAGLGIAIMPNFVIPEGSSVVKVPFETAQRATYGIAWHRSGEPEKIRQFVRITRSFYA